MKDVCVFLCDVLIVGLFFLRKDCVCLDGWPPFKHKKNGSFFHSKQISFKYMPFFNN